MFISSAKYSFPCRNVKAWSLERTLVLGLSIYGCSFVFFLADRGVILCLVVGGDGAIGCPMACHWVNGIYSGLLNVAPVPKACPFSCLERGK